MHKVAREHRVKPLPMPDKLFYKIGEVSKLTGVEPYVLRYWETEFSFLKPRKNKSGQRVYVKKDVEQITQIKRLLYQERYTIEGVRKRFGEGVPVSDTAQTQEPVVNKTQNPAEILDSIKKRLREIIRQIT